MDGVMIGSKSDLDSQVFATDLRILFPLMKVTRTPACLSTSAIKTHVKNLEKEVLVIFEDVHVNEQCIPLKLIQSLKDWEPLLLSLASWPFLSLLLDHCVWSG